MSANSKKLNPKSGEAQGASNSQAIRFADRIEQIALVDLCFASKALRKHPHRQLKLLVHNIERFGFITPIVLDQNNTIIAGEARVRAAKELAMHTVPAVRVNHLTEPEVRALRIADNKLSELSSWDHDALVLELVELQELHIELSDLGFVQGEWDQLYAAQIAKPLRNDLNDYPPCDRSRPAVTAPGDIWLCGPHRVACGDARDITLLERLMNCANAQMVMTDPPYNVAIAGNVSGLGKVKHPDFVMASGEMTDEEFNQFLTDALRAATSACALGALVYVFMDSEHLENLFYARCHAGLEKVNHAVWAKTNAGMGSLYRSQIEHVGIFKVPGAPHINNVELGRYGRNRSNLWKYDGANSFNRKRLHELDLHPTVKNAEMIADAILDATNTGGIVFDGFLGSGTTLIAAEDTGRVCYGMEIDSYYVDVILRRWEEFSGEPAVHSVSGQQFRACATCI